MTNYSANAQNSTTAQFAQRPGAMTSNEFDTVGGVQLVAGSISAMAAEIAGFRPSISRPSRPNARDEFIRQLQTSGSIQRSYSRSGNAGTVTLQFQWNGSAPSGSNWTPGDGNTWFVQPVFKDTNGDLYLAYDETSSGEFSQLKAQIETAELPEGPLAPDSSAPDPPSARRPTAHAARTHSTVEGPAPRWRTLQITREAESNPWFGFGNSLSHRQVPWTQDAAVTSIPVERRMAVVLLSPTRSHILGLRIPAQNAESQRIVPLVSANTPGAEERAHTRFWAIPLAAVRPDRPHLEILATPDAPEIVGLVDVVDERELATVRVVEQLIAKGNRTLLSAATYLLDLRFRDAKADHTGPNADYVRRCRLNFLAFDYVTSPPLQLARGHYEGPADLHQRLQSLAGHLNWDGKMQPETLRSIDFLFAEPNARFAGCVRPLTSLLFDRLSSLALSANDPVDPWSKLGWAPGVQHPPESPRDVVAYTADYMARAFQLFEHEPCPADRPGLGLPGDFLAFARGQLALGFQYRAGESIFNCVPNSIYFLLVCDLWLLAAEGHADAKQTHLFEQACRRAKLALAAERAYLLVYHPSKGNDSDLKLSDYSYLDGPFGDRLGDAQAEALLAEMAALPDSIDLLRQRHREACQSAALPAPAPLT